MENGIFNLRELTVRPLGVSLYVPPIVWKGDSVGHLGENDVFFWVLEGECFLTIDAQNYIIRPGQLAYLPKGKRRAYTHASERFSMYEMAFSAQANGENLMEALGLTGQDFVVDIDNQAEMSALFENSHRVEMFKNPLHNVAWCANIINIILAYARAHHRQSSRESLLFKPVLEEMSRRIDQPLRIDELAALVYMQPSYFIRRFRQSFSQPPMAYLGRMRMYKAMGMLAGTNLSIEQIAQSVSFQDASYFARLFKKHCGITPSEYRAQFKRDTASPV